MFITPFRCCERTNSKICRPVRLVVAGCVLVHVRCKSYDCCAVSTAAWDGNYREKSKNRVFLSSENASYAKIFGTSLWMFNRMLSPCLGKYHSGLTLSGAGSTVDDAIAAAIQLRARLRPHKESLQLKTIIVLMCSQGPTALYTYLHTFAGNATKKCPVATEVSTFTSVWM